jgi:small-conductance mechanosensitive channel
LRRYDWTRWLDIPLFGDPIRDWLLAAGIFVLFFAAFLVARRLVVHRMKRLAERTETEIDDYVIGTLRQTRWLLLVLPAIYLGSLTLDLTAKARGLTRTLAILSLLLQVALWALVSIDFWVEHTRRRRGRDAASATLLGALRFIFKLVLWVVILLFALDNLGVNITALVTGLGVGGIAIALALQNILGDLLASLSIVLDKPFVIGDSITVGDFTGTVESVGLKTTRLRSVNGEQIIFPNGDLLQSRIRNWGRLVERRVVLAFGLASATPPEQVERIPVIVREVIEAEDLVRFERAHLKAIGASSLDFEVVYWVLSPDQTAHMDCQQAVNLGILRRFAEEGIGFAFPTQTLIMERNPSAVAAGREGTRKEK